MPALPEPSIDAAFKAAAQSRYAELRARGPIHRARILNGLPCWMVVDYELARQALTHPGLLKDETLAAGTLDAYLAVRPSAGSGPSMLFTDPPDHTRLRRLAAAAFTRSRVAALRPRVTEIAEELADGIAAAGKCDLVRSYTSLLPVRVICELLGVREQEQGQFRDWTRMALGLPSPEQKLAFASLRGYLAALVAEKRREPADDLLSALIAVRDEQEGLSEDELIGTATLLVIAGHDTTVNLLGNAMIALFDHPEQAGLLRERPGLLKGAVEEFLRFDTSVEYTTQRYAQRDIELGGARIARGDIVLVSLTSANRSDPALAAAERDTLDVSRPAARHLAFGYGLHRCLGAPLAQLEAEVGIGTLLRRFPHLRPATPTSELGWIAAGMMRGPLTLPVTVIP